MVDTGVIVFSTKKLAELLQKCDTVQCFGMLMIEEYCPELSDIAWEEALDWNFGLFGLRLLEYSTQIGKHFKIKARLMGGKWVIVNDRTDSQ